MRKVKFAEFSLTVFLDPIGFDIVTYITVLVISRKLVSRILGNSEANASLFLEHNEDMSLFYCW